jgi:hypothetical protein
VEGTYVEAFFWATLFADMKANLMKSAGFGGVLCCEDHFHDEFVNPPTYRYGNITLEECLVRNRWDM